MAPNFPPATPAWYAQRWPWLLMLGPFLVLVAGGYTSWLAFSRPDALLVGDYYKQGQAINQDLRRDRAANALGLQAELAYDASHGILEGRLTARGAPQAGSLQLRLLHATLPEKDRWFALRLDGQGRFSAALPMLERSRWQVLIEDDGRNWRLEGNWVWPAQRALHLHADPAL